MNKFLSSAFGRQELACRYFPNILPRSAWKKLAAMLREHPALSPLADKRRRRTFTPAEAQQIFSVLGRP